MKTKFLLLGAALLAACGSSDQGWKTDELYYIPMLSNDPDEYTIYCDPRTNGEAFSVPEGSLFHDGYAIANTEDGYAFLDSKMQFHHPAEGYYQDVTIYNDGIAWAALPGKPLAAIDKKGNVLFEFKQAEAVTAFHEGLAVFVDSQGLWGAVDKNGKIISEPQWKGIGPMFVNGMIPVKDIDFNTWGIMNSKGEMVMECCLSDMAHYDENFLSNYVQGFREDRIPAKGENGKWGIISAKGGYIINPQFDEILLDGENYLFRKGKLYGWCDKKGQYLINPQFRSAEPFAGSELAAVQNSDREWGYIDRQGKWVVEAQFRDAKRFLACGIAPAQDANCREWGAIDKTGKWVINPQFQDMCAFGASDQLAVRDQADDVGIVGAEGQYIIAPSYADIPTELALNASGTGAKITAYSDYVDVESYAQLIDEEIRSLKKTTAGELKTVYGLKDANFPKSGGTVTLCKNKKAANDMSFKLTAAGVSAWSKVSDGWFGYDYMFRPDTPVDSYTLTVDFDRQGKARRFIEEIAETVVLKYPYDRETETFTVPGYSPIPVTVDIYRITFHIKPE